MTSALLPRIASAAAVAAAVTVDSAGIASAAPTPTPIPHRVGTNITIPDPAAPKTTNGQTPQRGFTTIRSGELTSQQRANLGFSLMSYGRCYYVYRFKRWTNAGVAFVDSWTQLNWCNNTSNTAIATYSRTNTGCRGLALGNCSSWAGPYWMWATSYHREIRMAAAFHASWPGFSGTRACSCAGPRWQQHIG